TLSACAGANRSRDVRDPRPENYKSDILAMLPVYLRDPTQIRDAAASEPTPQLVGRTNRYVVCLLFNAKKSNGEYAGLKQAAATFVAGWLDQVVEGEPGQCATADYQPCPEAERLPRYPCFWDSDPLRIGYRSSRAARLELAHPMRASSCLDHDSWM